MITTWSMILQIYVVCLVSALTWKIVDLVDIIAVMVQTQNLNLGELVYLLFGIMCIFIFVFICYL